MSEEFDNNSFDIMSFGMTIDEYTSFCYSQIEERHIQQNRNFFEIAKQKLSIVLNDNFCIPDSEKIEIKDTKEVLLHSIKDKMEEVFNITIDEHLLDMEDTLSELYHSMVVDYNKNTTDFIFDYIIQNKERISSNLPKIDSITKTIDYPDIMLGNILTNIVSVINEILHNNNFSYDTVLNHMGVSDTIINGIYCSEDFHSYFFRPMINLEGAGSTFIILNVSDMLSNLMLREEKETEENE